LRKQANRARVLLKRANPFESGDKNKTGAIKIAPNKRNLFNKKIGAKRARDFL
jgi:hypothetical protein